MAAAPPEAGTGDRRPCTPPKTENQASPRGHGATTNGKADETEPEGGRATCTLQRFPAPPTRCALLVNPALTGKHIVKPKDLREYVHAVRLAESVRSLKHPFLFRNNAHEATLGESICSYLLN